MTRLIKRIAASSVVLACLGAWTPAPPTGTSILLSKTYQLDADCQGVATDLVYSWHITGAPSQPNAAIYSWEAGDITIHGMELVIGTPPFMDWMLGSNARPYGDALIFAVPGETHRMSWFPASAGFQFPGTANADGADYIDLHGACASGHATAMVTIYYSLN